MGTPDILIFQSGGVFSHLSTKQKNSKNVHLLKTTTQVSTKHYTLLSALLGICVGVSFGLPIGWLAVHLCLIGLMLILNGIAKSPKSVAIGLGIFTFFMFISGHAGFATGTPSDVRLIALIPLAVYALVNAFSAATIGYLTYSLRLPIVVRLVVVLSSLWTLQEWLFSVGDIAIPWIRLGYAQTPYGPFAGALPLGGVLLSTWLTWAFTGLVVAGLLSYQTNQRRSLWGSAVLLVIVTLVVGRIQWTSPSGTLNVALVQSGVTSQTKERLDAAATKQLMSFYLEAIESSDAELIVTPQLAIPKTVTALPTNYLTLLDNTLKAKHADALIGMYFEAGQGAGLFNGALGVGASGTQHYLKSKLFPFGEFIPFGQSFRYWIDSYRSSRTQDTARPEVIEESLKIANHRAAVAICFEASFGEDWRRRALNADILVSMSSDSAINSKQLVRQFQVLERTRAMELQKPLLRTSDVDGTYVVDSYGNISEEAQAGVKHVKQSQVEARVGLTPYGRWGDAIPVGLSLFALGLVVLSLSTLASKRNAIKHPLAPKPAWLHRQVTGQVLPAAVGLLLVMSAVFYLMVNSGQTITEKIRVTNAADAAAYSAGIVEARALNYDAYMNRAMVANEIAIAQMVSLASWINYFATAADYYGTNASETNFFLLPDLKISPAPNVATLDGVFLVTNYISAYTGTSAQDYASYIVYVLGGIITVHDAIIQALSFSQSAVQANLAAGERQKEIANDVVKAMDPALNAELILITHGFDTFTKGYDKSGSAGDERGRMADVTVRSRDQFTRERNWTLSSFDIPLIRKNGTLKKRGGTDLIGFDEWRAVDTLELHGQHFGCGRFGLSWCSDVRTPIGWGAVEVDAGDGDAGAGYHGNAYNENSTTASNADANMKSPGNGDFYAFFHGIPDSRELKDLDPNSDITTGVTIRVTKNQSATLTSGNAAQAKAVGDLALFSDRPAGGQLAALSRAQVFFDRIADRADGKSEIGSLYNPYWRVRLVAPNAADKAYSAARQSLLVLP